MESKFFCISSLSGTSSLKSHELKSRKHFFQICKAVGIVFFSDFLPLFKTMITIFNFFL